MKTRTITEETWEQIQNKLNDLIINNDNLNQVILEKNQENESLRQTIEKLYNTNKQLQKLNKLVQHNYIIEINNQKKLYEEEQLYADTLKRELQESNKDKDMWKLRYFQLEKELQQISNMEKQVLQYLPLQKEFEERTKNYENQIQALNAALEEREQDLAMVRQQMHQRSTLNKNQATSNGSNLQSNMEIEDLKKENDSLLQAQLEQKKKIVQLELMIQNFNQSRQLQDQNKLEQLQTKQLSQQNISSSGAIRSDQQIDDSKGKQNQPDRLVENRRKKMSFNTESISDNNNEDNIYGDISDDQQNNNGIRNSLRIHQNNNNQNINSPIHSPENSTSKRQEQSQGALDNLDRKIDYLMRKQSRKISQAFTDLGSLQNLGQDSARGDKSRSSNNTSFSRPSQPTQGMRKDTQQTDELEDLLVPRQNASSFNSTSKSPRSLNINSARQADEDDKFMKNYNNNNNNNQDYPPRPLSTSKVPTQTNNQLNNHQRFSFQYENSNYNQTNSQNIQGNNYEVQTFIVNNNEIPTLSNTGINHGRPSEDNTEGNRTQEFSCLIERNEDDGNNFNELNRNILRDSLKAQGIQGVRGSLTNPKRKSQEGQAEDKLRERLNSQLSQQSQNQQNMSQNEGQPKKDQISNFHNINNTGFLTDTGVNLEVSQRLRLSSEELMQQRYQLQQQDEPSPVKKNSRNFKIEQKKRLSFQKELQIKVYKSQNNSEEDDDDDDYFDEQDENIVQQDTQLQNNKQERRESDLNSKYPENKSGEKRLSSQFNQQSKQVNQDTNESYRQKQLDQIEQKYLDNKQLQMRDKLQEEQAEQNESNQEKVKQQMIDSARIFKGQEILENRIRDEIEKQLALQRRLNIMEQEKVNMILLLQQKQEEVEKIHKEEIIILEQKIEALEQNQNQMQNLIIQYQLQNQQQNEKEIDLQHDIETKQLFIEQLTEKINNMQEKLDKFKIAQQQMKELDNQLKEKKITVSNLEVQVSQLLRENERTNEQYENLQHQMTVSMVNKDQLRQKDQELEEVKQVLEKIPKEYKEIVYTMQQTVDDIENKMREEQISFQKKIQQLNKKHQETINEMRVEFDTQMIKLQTTQEQMQIQLNEKHQQNLDLQNETQIIKNQNDELNNLLQSNQQQFAQQMEKTNLQSSEKFERELLHQRNQLTQDKLELERKIIELKSQIDVDKMEARKLCDQLEDSELLIKELRNKIEQKDQQLTMQTSTFDENINTLERKLHQLDRINEDLKKVIQQKDVEIKKLYLSREEELANQQELEQQCKSLEEIFQQFKEEKTQYEKKIMDLVDKIFDLQQQLSIVTKEKKEWQKLNENKTKQIEEYQKKLVHLNIDFNSTQLEISVSPQKKLVDSALQESNPKSNLVQLDFDFSQNQRSQNNNNNNNGSIKKSGTYQQRLAGSNHFNNSNGQMIRIEEDSSSYEY